MTGMEQIAQINGDARAAGTSYGKYVALHGAKYGSPKGARQAQDKRKCRQCGKDFFPPLNSNGTPAKVWRCPTCQDNPQPLRRLQIYIRQCTACGCDIETTQPPRNGRLFCKACKREARRRRWEQKIG